MFSKQDKYKQIENNCLKLSQHWFSHLLRCRATKQTKWAMKCMS